jgi:hypothetical protein
MLPADRDQPDAQTSPAGADQPGEPQPGQRPWAQAARAWRSLAGWRQSRPFWAGVLLIGAGLELLLIPLPVHSMGLILHIGTGGVLGIVIGALLIAAAVALWLTPQHRHFYAIMAILLSIAALIASNLGGFLLGTLLGVLGGSLGLAWAPWPEPGDDRSDGDDAGPRRRWRWRGPGVTPLDDVPGEARSGSAVLHAAPVPVLLAVLMGMTGVVTSGSPATTAPKPAASASASPDPSPSASPSPDPSASPSPSPSPSPSASASGSASPAPSASSSSGSPAPSSSPAPTASAPGGLIAATQASSITATSATLDGLTFDGVATVKTASGTEQVLRFSLSSLTLDGADLTIQRSGTPLTISATEFDFSGGVTLLATKLSGTLLGASVTFTPADPPPAALPSDLTLTSVAATQVFTSAGSFTVTGLRITD